MQTAALYHTPDRRFCYALEPGRFLIRLCTAADDLRRVTLHMQDKYIPVKYQDTRTSQPMEKVASDGIHDYYEAVIRIDMVCLRYYFEAEDMDGRIVYYGNYSFSREKFTDIEDMFDCPQNQREEECFDVPSWAAGSIVYQIFPSRFASSGNVSEEKWYQAPIGGRENLKGDLRGIIEHLPHIHDLGVDVIYMTPIFKASSYHKYDTEDYYQIDPHFGTEEDLRELVERAHQMGMRVILDAVFNHTSRNFFAFHDIELKREQSQYLDWYYIKSFPLKANWGEKPSFLTFSYYGGMPKLNLGNEEVTEYLLGAVRYWMRSCKIDGWRLDVGDEIIHSFWRRFRKCVKEENPDALIVGEAWHLTGDYLEGDEWDTIMNYDFRAAALGFAAKGWLPSQTADRLGFLRGNVHTRVYPLLWNLIDSHDTERALYSCGEDKARFKLAIAMQLLSVGMPMIYYGDEYGMTGAQDPDCRRGMLWDKSRQDAEIYAWYQMLIRIRKENPAITSGTTTDIYTDDKNGILAVTRRAADNNIGSEITMIFHNGSNPAECAPAHGRDLLSGKQIEGQLLPWQVIVMSNEK